MFAWSGSAYTLSAQTKFIYDGWNLVAETDASNTVQRSYVWGNDLSGTLQGAGGVGGLLAIKAGEESFLPGYDGNGNVMALVKSSNQSISASYTYGAFGEAIQADEVGVANPFRFSTKYHDAETSLVYYGYRYYNPVLGRWVNRDPIEEEGGVNVFGFVRNSPLSFIDPDGRNPLGIVIAAVVAVKVIQHNMCEQFAMDSSIQAKTDSEKHCLVSCNYARCVGNSVGALGASQSIIAGAMHEIIQFGTVGNSWVGAVADMKSNLIGIINGMYPFQSCNKACEPCKGKWNPK